MDFNYVWYEKLFIYILQQGVTWPLSSPTRKDPFDNKLLKAAKTVKGAIPMFSHMKPGTLYYSLRSNFPFGDIFLMDGGRTLHVFNNKAGKSIKNIVLKKGPYDSFLKEIGMSVNEASEHLCYYVVPLHM